MREIRCKKCNKKLGLISGSYEIKCPRCGEMNVNKINMNTVKESVKGEYCSEDG